MTFSPASKSTTLRMVLLFSSRTALAEQER